MALPVLGSPLPGFIHPKEWVRPAGNTEFEVTSTLADHIASGRAKGTDFWNTQCGAAVRLMLPGTCYQKSIQPIHNPPQIGDGALIARFRHADGGNTGYAHLASFGSIVVGGAYPQGHIVGVLGKTGASACHLHAHYQDAAGVHHEVYDLLAQNQEADMDPSFSPKPNATVTVNKGARHRLAPTTADPANIAIASDPGGPLGFPLMGTVVGQAVNGNAIWYAYWRPDIPVPRVYYLHTSTCGPETPWETVSSGYTEQDLTDAKKVAANIVSAAASAAAGKF